MKRWIAVFLCVCLLMTAGAGLGEEILDTFQINTSPLGIEMAPTQAIPAWPELNADGFLSEGEFIHEDEENGVWMYCSSTLKIQIFRYYDPQKVLTWFESEIWCAPEEAFRMISYDPGDWKSRADPMEIARKYQTVYAQNGDYYIYRSGKKQEEAKGIVIRDGKVLYRVGYENNKGFFPNLDCLALFPDGDMKVFLSSEHTPEEYLDMGARDVLSFGPYMIRDGVVNPKIGDYGRTNQPRGSIGMVEKGHYMGIVLEARIKRSKGETIAFMADRLKSRGCQTAFNLDGGQTAVMVFMGKQLNVIGKYDGKTWARPQNEILGIGVSAQVK